MAELESLLGLDRGDLMALLGPRRPRGRRAGARARTDLLPDSGAAADISGQSGRIRLLYVEEHVRVNPDRSLREIVTRSVVEARDDGVSRYHAGNLADAAADLSLVRTVAIGGSRLGRVQRDHAHRLVSAEFLLDRAYRRGEAFTVQYKFFINQPVFDTEYFRVFTAPFRFTYCRSASPAR
uniref:hypothetical protein n=1 Tax=Saccharothrix mutabilis TaxID=33921 RepID=UPI0031D7FCB7